MPSIVVLVGNPQSASRTRLVAEEVARQLADRGGAVVEPTIDLADVAGSLFRFPDAEIDALLGRVASADVLIVASPTYKATYTGLLKAFLDRYGSNGLAGVTAVPILTIGGPGHALAVEHGLRPLLVELGASTPTAASRSRPATPTAVRRSSRAGSRTNGPGSHRRSAHPWGRCAPADPVEAGQSDGRPRSVSTPRSRSRPCRALRLRTRATTDSIQPPARPCDVLNLRSVLS